MKKNLLTLIFFGLFNHVSKEPYNFNVIGVSNNKFMNGKQLVSSNELITLGYSIGFVQLTLT